MKKVAKRIMIIFGIVILSMLLLVGFTLAMALPGLEETTSLEIHSVDLVEFPTEPIPEVILPSVGPPRFTSP